MEEIDYQSPDTGRVAPEHMEEAYGGFPAVLAIVLAMAGCLVASLGRLAANRWAAGAIDLVGAAGVAGGWAAAVATPAAPPRRPGRHVQPGGRPGTVRGAGLRRPAPPLIPFGYRP